MKGGSMHLENALTFDEYRLVSLWHRLVTTLGIHTARVLLARAIWQTAQRHPDIALIHHDDAGLTFDALETSYATRPQKEIDAAFSDLTAELLLLLDRLLGREMAQQIGAAA
jgi:predicted O-methyltransferase YrrM